MEDQSLNNIFDIAILLLVLATRFWRSGAATTSPGPAPKSGDGVPDGSGFELPSFPVELAIVLLILLIGSVVVFFRFKRRKQSQLAIVRQN